MSAAATPRWRRAAVTRRTAWLAWPSAELTVLPLTCTPMDSMSWFGVPVTVPTPVTVMRAGPGWAEVRVAACAAGAAGAAGAEAEGAHEERGGCDADGGGAESRVGGDGHDRAPAPRGRCVVPATQRRRRRFPISRPFPQKLSQLPIWPAVPLVWIAFGVRAGSRGEVLDRQAERLKDGDLFRARPAGRGPGKQLTQLGPDLVRPDRPVSGGQQVVAGLGQQRVPAVGEQHARRDRGGVELAHVRQAGADRVDVRAGLDPVPRPALARRSSSPSR